MTRFGTFLWNFPLRLCERKDIVTSTYRREDVETWWPSTTVTTTTSTTVPSTLSTTTQVTTTTTAIREITTADGLQEYF